MKFFFVARQILKSVVFFKANEIEIAGVTIAKQHDTVRQVINEIQEKKWIQ